MSNVPFIVDFSSWQSAWTAMPKVSFTLRGTEAIKLLKDRGLTAAIARAGYGTTKDFLVDTLIGFFRALKIPFGLYWYLYPGINAEAQISKFLEVSKAYPDATCFFIDVEEYKANKVVLSKSYLEAFYKRAWDDMHIKFAGKKSGVYTANWCITSFFPNVISWIPKTDGWFADYVKYYGWWQGFINSLGGSWGDNTRPISIDNLPAIFREVQKHAPVLPRGIIDWGIWQCFTFVPFSELTLYQRHLDYNLATPKAFKYWFNVDIVEEPPVVPPVGTVIEYKVIAYSLNVRTGPSTGYSIKKSIPFGTVIKALEEKNGWVRYADGWVSKNYLVEVTSTPEPPVPTTFFKVKVLETIFIRESPGTLSGKLGYAVINQVLDVTRSVDGWYKLSTGGWITSNPRYTVKI